MNKFLITVFAATAFVSPTLANAQAAPATGNKYPPCSATRMDECTQAGKVVHKAKGAKASAHKAKAGKHHQMKANGKKPAAKAQTPS